MYLQAGGIKPNYKSLLSNAKIQSIIRERFGGLTRFVSGGARVLLKLAPSKVEEVLLEKIWTEENRSKVQSKVIEAIMQYGIEADIGEIIVRPDLGLTNYYPKQDKLYLPESLQCVLVDAVAGYLREKAVQNNLTSGMAPTKVNSMTQGGKKKRKREIEKVGRIAGAPYNNQDKQIDNDPDYFITADCMGCMDCMAVCPADCIVVRHGELHITADCVGCGLCKSVCPIDAIISLV